MSVSFVTKGYAPNFGRLLKNMQIGIITLPLHVNYGGILQAYALQNVLKRLGHSPVLLDKGWPPYENFNDFVIRLFKYSFNRLFHRKTLPIKQFIYRNKYINAEHINTIKFVETYITRKNYVVFPEIKEDDYDAFIVGSDQIWRKSYFNPIEHAFLDFADSWAVKRLAYAVSFGGGTVDYTKKEIDNCRRLVTKFDAIGMRESSGVDLVKTVMGTDAVQVLDPTMLLSKEDYIEKLSIDTEEGSNGDMLVYILDMTEEKIAMVEAVSKSLHLKPFYVNERSDKIANNDCIVYPRVEKWLRGFYDAKFVFTDSFHACAFSIIFNVPFIAYGNKVRGVDRFYSLLGLFELESRCISNLAEVKSVITANINWQKVNIRWKKERTKSIDFLVKYLGYGEHD